ncbi:hypothetical protein L1O48_06295 [Ligilactobacillus equi]
MTQASDLLLDETAIAPLYQPSTATMLKAKVKGVAYDSVGQYNFKDVYIK